MTNFQKSLMNLNFIKMNDILYLIENDEINNDIINKITRIINEERSIPSEITNIINDIKYRLNDEVKKSPSLSYNRTELYRKLKMIYPKKRMVRFYSRIIII